MRASRRALSRAAFAPRWAPAPTSGCSPSVCCRPSSCSRAATPRSTRLRAFAASAMPPPCATTSAEPSAPRPPPIAAPSTPVQARQKLARREPLRQVLERQRVAVLDRRVGGVEDLEEDIGHADLGEGAAEGLRAQVEVPLVPLARV